MKDGEDANFLVRCNGIPKPDIKWYKDEKELTDTDRITLKTQTEGQVSTSLDITQFQADDVGEVSL